MKCPQCKQGHLFKVPPPEGDPRASWACTNMDCDFQQVGGHTPEEVMEERDERISKRGATE